MPGVFISYAAVDRDAALLLADALSRVGLDPLFDVNMEAGDSYHLVLERAITSSLRVIVLWSEASVTSRWVLSEAEMAAVSKKLVPIKLDNCNVPVGFSSIHCEGFESFLANLPRKAAAWQEAKHDECKLIAVVDDDPTTRNIVSSILQMEGYTVVSFENSIDALRELERSPPDLAVIDFVMPRIDGIELIRKLRFLGAKYPIIVLTSRTANDDEVLGLVSGGDDYVHKPLRIQTFLARVRAHLRKSPR
jgi:CheY-like chemotaxis protein